MYKLLKTFTASKHREIQYANPAAQATVQLELLQKHVRYAEQNSPFYKNLFGKAGVSAEQITSLNDLKRFPLTGKEDLIAENEKFLAVPAEQIVDVCLTSASTGSRPTQLHQTASDLARLAYNEEVAFAMTGLTEKDTLLVAAALDRAFMAGLAYFMGGVRNGATVIRGGAGSAAQLWELIKSTAVTAIVGVPSLIKKIADYAVEQGENPALTEVRRLIAIGEPTRDTDLKLLSLPAKLEEMWQAEIYSTYASTELATTFCECSVRQGGHLRPEMMVVEIVDEQGNPVPTGEKGEVVVTPMGVTGMPLVRFRTGDISYLIEAPCPCGRQTPRLAPILGRKQQMLKFKGTTVFPNAIIAALEGMPHFYGGYVEATTSADGLDRVCLFAHWDKEQLTKKEIENQLQAKIRVVPEVKFVSADQVQAKVYQFEKKRKRRLFYDLRNQ